MSWTGIFTFMSWMFVAWVIYDLAITRDPVTAVGDLVMACLLRVLAWLFGRRESHLDNT